MTARFLTLSPIFLQPRGTTGGERIVPPGVEINYDGPAGPTLYPLNDAAREAQARVLERRNPQQRVRHDIVQRRALRGLPRHLRRRCEQADAEGKADV